MVFRRNCGGARGFSLTCACKGTFKDPNAKATVVCVRPQDTCKSLEFLEHEFVHVEQIGKGLPIGVPEELEAYRKSCETEAKQKCSCLTDDELSEWIRKCVAKKVGGSLGRKNRGSIGKGCARLCGEYKQHGDLKDSL